MSTKILKIVLLFCLSTLINAEPEPVDDGKYRPITSSKTNPDGKYVRTNAGPGRYIPMSWPYMHTHDNRELGRYVHVHIPYDGGYGPYSGVIDKYRYEGDPRGDYSLYTTTTTTTPKPRIRYDDEGKWRILRQEEDKNPKKYDYLYLTENGIYAEEQGKTVNRNQEATGTSGKGWYHYTGDDGELYRVDYTAGEQGFLPMADHLPSQLKKALDFLAAKDKAEQEAQERLG